MQVVAGAENQDWVGAGGVVNGPVQHCAIGSGAAGV